MSIKKLINQYQKAFNNHDLIKLEVLFDNKIILKDWDTDVSGKKKVLAANAKIFKTVKNIKCKPIQIIISGRIAVCEVNVIVNKKKINVVDIIKFNKKQKIISIKAFKI